MQTQKVNTNTTTEKFVDNDFVDTLIGMIGSPDEGSEILALEIIRRILSDKDDKVDLLKIVKVRKDEIQISGNIIAVKKGNNVITKSIAEVYVKLSPAEEKLWMDRIANIKSRIIYVNHYRRRR